MSKLDLSKYGITDVKEILHNPSYEELFKAETDPSLTGRFSHIEVLFYVL